MTAGELARVAAQTIVDRVSSQPAPGRTGYRAPEEIAAELIQGVINRALDDQRLAVQEIVHVHSPPLGGVDVKVTKSTQGVSLEVDLKRPREQGESYEDAAAASARIAALAYLQAAEALMPVGLVPGKEPKG